ncbi:MAG: hypothetical protein ACRD30_02580 [Bryobacteraceae bacterium]
MRGFLFWDYHRGTWQYDVIVALILAFIFAVPHDFFHDQPKAPSVVMLRGGFWIDPQVFDGVPDNQLAVRATSVVDSRYKTRAVIGTVEPVYGAEREIKGYMAFTK